MDVGLTIVISVSLATSMTIAYRHQNLAPVALASAVKIGVLIGLAIPAYLLLYPQESMVLSMPSSASQPGVSNEISLREALSMISCMLLGSFFMSAFLERVRKMAALGSGSEFCSYPYHVNSREIAADRERQEHGWQAHPLRAFWKERDAARGMRRIK